MNWPMQIERQWYSIMQLPMAPHHYCLGPSPFTVFFCCVSYLKTQNMHLLLFSIFYKVLYFLFLVALCSVEAWKWFDGLSVSDKCNTKHALIFNLWFRLRVIWKIYLQGQKFLTKWIYVSLSNQISSCQV